MNEEQRHPPAFIHHPSSVRHRMAGYSSAAGGVAWAVGFMSNTATTGL